MVPYEIKPTGSKMISNSNEGQTVNTSSVSSVACGKGTFNADYVNVSRILKNK